MVLLAPEKLKGNSNCWATGRARKIPVPRTWIWRIASWQTDMERVEGSAPDGIVHRPATRHSWMPCQKQICHRDRFGATHMSTCAPERN